MGGCESTNGRLLFFDLSNCCYKIKSIVLLMAIT